MTDEVIEKDVASIPAEDTQIEAEAQIEEKPQEKMIPVSRVEELIKKAKLKGRDNMQAELDAIKEENENLKQAGGSMGGMAVPMNTDEIRQQVLNDLKKEFQEASETRANEELQRKAEQIATEYNSKMKAGKASFEDFDDVMADFRPEAFPNLVYLANEVENTPAVMYELMKNPSKWATLTVLSERDPVAAKKMIGRISTSILANEQAKATEREVAPPLSRLSSSTAGKDSGELSVQDFRQMFKG